MKRLVSIAAAAVAALAATGLAAAPDFAVPAAWTRPTAAFPVIGPVWYVGSEGLAAYLIKTRAGAILIDGTMAQNVPGILANIRRAGVAPRDVKLLLVTHAHFDHVAGDAAMVRATGTRVIAGAADVAALESGIPPGEVDYKAVSFPPVKVAHGVADGEAVTLGGITLRAIATPGHTPGCTSWALRLVEGGQPRDILFLCSLTGGGNILLGNRRYPGIVGDFRRSFAKVGALHADVVLPAHPEIADVMQHRRDGQWLQPGLLQRIVAKAQSDFDAELARQQRGGK